IKAASVTRRSASAMASTSGCEYISICSLGPIFDHSGRVSYLTLERVPIRVTARLPPGGRMSDAESAGRASPPTARVVAILDFLSRPPQERVGLSELTRPGGM